MNGGSVVIVDVFSAVALGTTLIGLLPQIYKTYKTKSAEDLSMLMLANYVLSSMSWIGYGVCVSDSTVIAANVMCGTTAVILIVQKIYYDRQDRIQHDFLIGENGHNHD